MDKVTSGRSKRKNYPKDREFSPTAEMMVDDYDDERTLDEEEALNGVADAEAEINSLQKEQDMPLDDLLAMYGCQDADTTRSSSSDDILSNQDLTLDKDEISTSLLSEADDTSSHVTSPSLASEPSSASKNRFLRSVSRQPSDDEDEEYTHDEPDTKKSVLVGPDYQALVPESLSKYGDTLPYENEDKLLWDPHLLQEEVVENYLSSIRSISRVTPPNSQVVAADVPKRDDEQALYLLLQCGHNVEEALRRKRMSSVPPTDTMSLWSEEECLSYEMGLRIYGKDFYLIQQNKVRTRSVGELVQFYYLWKKSERHDVFANTARLDKKKYATHPKSTDFMDRFLDEQENPSPGRDRSSSPNVNSLMSTDHKRKDRSTPEKILANFESDNISGCELIEKVPEHLKPENIESPAEFLSVNDLESLNTLIHKDQSSIKSSVKESGSPLRSETITINSNKDEVTDSHNEK